MRTVSGEIVLPADVAPGAAARILVEVRDVSVVDAPSSVLASTILRRATLASRGRIPFALQVPEAPGRRLALRVQIDRREGTRSLGGDYLTTESLGIADSGDMMDVIAPVKPSR